MEASFFQPEWRDGIYVDEKQKRVWAVELGLLETLLTICEQKRIPCMAIGGTLIGAVRHKGFIPWDDDIDIGMLRPDYERFLREAPAYLPPYLTLQTTEAEPRCYRTHAQMRDDRTTGYLEREEQFQCSKGIFIDIFPIDRLPDSRLRYSLQIWTLKGLNRLLTNYFFFDAMHTRPDMARRLFHALVCLLVRAAGGHKRVFRLYDACCKRYEYAHHCRMAGQLSVLFDNTRYQWPREWLERQVRLPFEGLQIPVPEQYRQVLKKTFGDYMTLPKEEDRRGALHETPIFEPELSYAEYRAWRNAEKAHSQGD